MVITLDVESLEVEPSNVVYTRVTLNGIRDIGDILSEIKIEDIIDYYGRTELLRELGDADES